MDYKTFHSLFLEMPQRLNGGTPYTALSQAIDITLEYEEPIKSLGDDVYQAGDYYWVGNSDASIKKLIVGTTRMGNLLKVDATGKDPSLVKQPPYAIDLYLKIANSLNTGIKFASDQILSDDGFRLWKRIFDQGHKLLIYNNKLGKYEPTEVKSAQDLEQYFTDDGLDYQYVIAESSDIGKLMGNFEIMEWKRLSGYPLEKLFKED